MIAKPVIEGSYWIIKDGDNKVGELSRDGRKFTLKMGRQVTAKTSMSEVIETHKVVFARTETAQAPIENQLMGFPTTGTPYNVMYDIKNKAPLYTKTPKSKAYHAAGWYKILKGKTPKWEFCPKLISLQRYEFHGPFGSIT